MASERDATGEPYTLIIVDDEPAIRSGLADMVDWEALGFTVCGTFEDGRDALRFIRHRQIDVILTDIKMRHISGLELARGVKDRYPETEIILLTGYREFELAREAIKAHVRDYILKPTNVSDLKRIFQGVRDLLDRRSASAAKTMSMQAIERRLFFRDLVTATIANRREFDERFSLLGFGFDPDASSCCTLSFRWGERPEDPAVFSFIERLLRARSSSGPLLFETIETAGTPGAVAIAPGSQDMSEFARHIDRASAEVRTSLQESFGIGVNVLPGTFVNGLWSLACAARDSGSHPPPSLPEADESPAGSALAIVRRSCRYVQENFHRDLSLEEVASQAHLSPAYFSTFFRKHVGLTFTDYLAAVRIDKAKDILREPGVKIMDLARRVGYRDSRHFSQMFKRHTGYTPTEYVRGILLMEDDR